MRISIFLFLTFLPLSVVTSEDYFRTREIFVLACPMDEVDEGDAPKQFGGGFAYHFLPRIGVEFYYSRGSNDHKFQYPSDPETGDAGYISTKFEHLRSIASRMLIHFSKSRLIPYGAFGGALVNVHNKGRDRNFDQGPEEIFFDETTNHFGFDCNMGIKYHFTPEFTIRSEFGSILMERSLVKVMFLVSYHF